MEIISSRNSGEISARASSEEKIRYFELSTGCPVKHLSIALCITTFDLIQEEDSFIVRGAGGTKNEPGKIMHFTGPHAPFVIVRKLFLPRGFNFDFFRTFIDELWEEGYVSQRHLKYNRLVKNTISLEGPL